MMLVALLALLVAQTFAHTSNVPTSTEPSVTDNFGFRYDAVSHIMAVMTHRKCYLYTMSADESAAVHAAHGLHVFETKLINMVDDTTQTYKAMSHDDVSKSWQLATTCNRAGWTSYKLN